MPMKLLRSAAVGLLVSWMPVSGWAQSDATGVPIGATVIDSARIISVVEIDFGDYDPTSLTAERANGSLSWREPDEVPWELAEEFEPSYWTIH